MKLTRLVLAGAALLSVTVALAAAPATKRPSSTRVALPSTISPAIPHEAKPDNNVPGFPDPAGNQPSPAIPETDYSVPQIEQPEFQSPDAASVLSAPINMNWYSINNGGATEVTAGNIKMGISIGQNAVGEVAAGNIKLGLGFWYGASGNSTPPCACDCHNDPQCDGITDIFDVTRIVNVAFRGETPITDPNNLCHLQTTDVDCNGVTNIFDVTHMVNVAFRGDNPATEFCSGCAPAL